MAENEMIFMDDKLGKVTYNQNSIEEDKSISVYFEKGGEGCGVNLTKDETACLIGALQSAFYAHGIYDALSKISPSIATPEAISKLLTEKMSEVEDAEIGGERNAHFGQ